MRGRPPDPSIKRDILARVADYVLKNGWADGSLRRVGRAVGTSARMLIYHFGSAHQLLTAAIGEIRDRQQRQFLEGITGNLGNALETSQRLWRQTTAPERDRYNRFFYWVLGQALLEPDRFSDLLEMLKRDFVPLYETSLTMSGMPVAEARLRATLLGAVSRGLLIDYLITGDRQRCEEAELLFNLEVEQRLKSVAGDAAVPIRLRQKRAPVPSAAKREDRTRPRGARPARPTRTNRRAKKPRSS